MVIMFAFFYIDTSEKNVSFKLIIMPELTSSKITCICWIFWLKISCDLLVQKVHMCDKHQQ